MEILKESPWTRRTVVDDLETPRCLRMLGSSTMCASLIRWRYPRVQLHAFKLTHNNASAYSFECHFWSFSKCSIYALTSTEIDSKYKGERNCGEIVIFGPTSTYPFSPAGIARNIIHVVYYLISVCFHHAKKKLRALATTHIPRNTLCTSFHCPFHPPFGIVMEECGLIRLGCLFICDGIPYLRMTRDIYPPSFFVYITKACI